MKVFDGYAIDVSGGTLNICLMSLDNLLEPEEKRWISDYERKSIEINCSFECRVEPDPFPDVLKEQVSRVLYEVNNALLQKRLLPWGGVSDMLAEYDHENQLALENSCLNGLLHHKRIKYPKIKPWFEEWEMIGA